MRLSEITFQTKVSQLIKTEDVRDIVSNMFREIDAEVNPAREALAAGLAEGGGIDWNQIIADEPILAIKGSERLSDYNDFLHKLYKAAQRTVTTTITREKSEIRTLKEKINERIKELEEDLENLDKKLTECNNAIAAGNAAAANGDTVDLSGVYETKAATEASIAICKKEKIELEIELEECNHRISEIGAIHIDGEGELIEGTAQKGGEVVSTGISREERIGGKVEDYARQLSNAIERGDGDEVDQITEEIYRELKMDPDQFDVEVARLYNYYNETGDHEAADNIRALASTIMVNKEDKEAFNKLTGATISYTDGQIVNWEAQGGNRSDIEIPNQLSVPTNYADAKVAVANNQPIVLDGVVVKIDKAWSTEDFTYIDAQDRPRYFAWDGHGVYREVDESGVKIPNGQYFQSTDFLNGNTSSAGQSLNYWSPKNDTYLYSQEDITRLGITPLEPSSSTPAPTRGNTATAGEYTASSSLPMQTTEGPTPLPAQTVEGSVQPEGGSTSGGPAPGGSGSTTTAMLN